VDDLPENVIRLRVNRRRMINPVLVGSESSWDRIVALEKRQFLVETSTCFANKVADDHFLPGKTCSAGTKLSVYHCCSAGWKNQIHTKEWLKTLICWTATKRCLMSNGIQRNQPFFIQWSKIDDHLRKIWTKTNNKTPIFSCYTRMWIVFSV